MLPVSHVLLFSLDGLRPDALSATPTPNLDAVAAAGGVGVARTTMPSVTLPCHASMFLGVPTERHGVTTNLWMPPVRPVDSITDAARKADLTTAAVYNWEPLRDLSRPGSLHISLMYKDNASADSDVQLARQAAAHLAADPTHFAFIYFGHIDSAGHKHGWMSDEYLAAVTTADQAVGVVLDAYRAAGLMDSTAVIVTADHGGHERSHGTDQDEDMLVPVAISLPGGPPPSLNGHASILDIAPTVARLLGFPPAEEWEGQALV